MITSIIGLVQTLAGAFIDDPEVKKAKVEAKVKKEQAKSEWEIEQARAGDNSNKDEAIIYSFLLIFILGFVPTVQDYILTGWKIVEQYPVWFQGCFVTVVLASFGIRVKQGFMKRNKG